MHGHMHDIDIVLAQVGGGAAYIRLSYTYSWLGVLFLSTCAVTGLQICVQHWGDDHILVT